MSDFDLAHTLGGAALAFRADRTDVSELIANLLDRIPEVRSRILRLIETDALPDEDRECAVQILELWAEGPLPELWSHVPRT
jgi:hypothetical protein